LDLREQTEDAAGIAIALNNLGLVARNLGDYARASTLLEQSITQCRALGDAIGIAYALTSLGEVARLQGDIPRAVMLYEESLLRWQELDNQGGMATALHNLGYMALRQQNTRLALKHFRAGLTIFQQHGNQRGLALCLAGLAGAAGQMGQPARAARLFGAEHTLHETIGASLEPADRADRDQHITFVRSQLDAPTFQINWNEGTLMRVEQAVSYANSDA
jgi:tetratricopeptide (TPR) repeat protein